MIQATKFIFFGTPLFAVRVLSQLVGANLIPLAVVTNPDRPVGRKQIMTPSAVKLFIEQLPSNPSAGSQPPLGYGGQAGQEKIKVLSPEKLDKAFTEILKELKPDFFMVAAYGKIIPGEALAIPPLGVIGVHPSLLPKYRGASPIQSALLAGEQETGVSLYFLDEKMDAGSVIAQETVPIQSDETYETLAEKLANVSGKLLLKNLPDLKSAKLNAEIQDETKATYTKKFKT
ncbi:MAG: methionyl-tRNA formyltransferase, partial [bacterium]|nr:methionyl-tRNA formyltransferase [bacterium]